MTLLSSIVFFNRTAILVASGEFETEGWGALIFLPLEYVPAFALTPRFIMSVRALRPQNQQDGQEHETDVEFGSIGSQHGDHATEIVLDIGQPASEVAEQDEEIPLEEWRITLEHW